jgi:hypothetical protein
VSTTTTTCRTIAVPRPQWSAAKPVTGTPIAPVMKPTPSTSPEARPARSASSSWAIISISGDVDAASRPTIAPVTKPCGPGNSPNSSTTGIVSTSEAITIVLRPKRSASEPHPTVPSALARTTVVARGP